jgi:TLD
MTTDLQRFTELYVFSIRGTIDERSGLMMCSLGYQNDEEENEISYDLLQEYVEAVVSSYMMSIRDQGRYKSWCENGIGLCQANIRHLAEVLTYDAISEGQQHITRYELEQWLEKNPTFAKMLKIVFTHLYNFHQQPDGAKKLELDTFTDLLPMCEDHDHKELPALIDVSQVVFINSNLPTDLEGQWRFLFSSDVHGHSFSALLRKISKQGPTVLIIEDTNGHVFGGFAPASWKLCSNFVGNDTARLFSLKPKMRCFTPTGYNSHYQYLNLHQQTMPNGLGMGGQLDFWGLWLDGEFGTGVSSESCTTFESFEQLSGCKKFEIKTMEVWAVGPEPQPDEDEVSLKINIRRFNETMF